ncbi:MAG TPA: isoprenylcysteine carboxylmethyltransferase family protein [Acidobacteriaceae bacterium]
MPSYGYLILAAGWIFWFLPFPLTGWTRSTPQKTQHVARWGLLLQIVAYLIVWCERFWAMSPAPWRIALSVSFFALAILLSWTSTRALGRHLRFDAALSADHELVQSGVYGILRHPIYLSMLCLLLGTGFMVAPSILFMSAILVFLVGTEIRVRTEDSLLASRFGDRFHQYQKRVSAYIPFVR